MLRTDYRPDLGGGTGKVTKKEWEGAGLDREGGGGGDRGGGGRSRSGGGGVGFDVGGYVGEFAAAIAGKYADAVVHVFEPVEQVALFSLV